MRTIIYYLLLFHLFILSNAFAEGTWTYITEIDSQEIRYVGSMASEEDGTIWVCSSNGVFRYKDRTWSNESTHFNGAIFGIGEFVTVSPNGNVWFSCNPSFLVKYDGENWYSYNYTESSAVFFDIGADAQDNVWCCSDIGVFKFDGSVWKKHTTKDGLARNYASRVKISPEGDVWVRYGGLYDIDKPTGIYPRVFGVSRYDGSNWKTFNTENGLKSNKVDDIAFGPDGLTYISYGRHEGDLERGIVRFDGSRWETISEPVNGILEFDRDGTLWIVNGFSYLYKFDGNSVEKCPDKPSGVPTYTRTMCIDSDGNIWLGVFDGIVKYDIQTGIHHDNELKPHDFMLLTNYPNPFNSSTNISFELPESSHAYLTVYNANGQNVAELVDGVVSSGEHSVKFDGSNLASGIYLYRFKSKGFEKTSKMILVK
ncbi:T9SS type A sorting domain-containing protein [Candidatus Latescibacterota bacterium]